MTKGEYMSYLKYEMWNYKIPEDVQQNIMAGIYVLADKYTPEEVDQLLIDDQKKFGK